MSSENQYSLSFSNDCRRHGGHMVTVLNSASSRPCLSPGQVHCVMFLARHFTLTVPFSTQVYKWVLANVMLVGNPVTDKHHIQGGEEILLMVSCNIETEDKHWPDGQTFLLHICNKNTC